MIANAGDFRLSFGVGPAHDELRYMVGNCRAPKIRSRREFAEQELIIPEGPFKDRRFKVARQPYTGLWLDACDASLTYQAATSKFRRIITTGPSQSGKSFLGTVTPVLYHLFEIGETVGFSLPDMDMANDKWQRDILPALSKTRYRDLLPDRGEGSQGGKVNNMVQFKNGAALKFFSAGGSDKSRAGFTCRVLIITEANAFGGSAETSNESTKLEQILARTLSFGSSALVYMECTVEIETDVIWSHYSAGTGSRIACPCPHCQAFVTPEREDLVGWQECTNSEEAQEKSHFQCPACEHKLNDADRRAMNEKAVLLHRGQSIELDTPKRKRDAEQLRVTGETPRTDMLGFRWNAFNNLFLSAGQLGQFEWEGRQSTDEDAHERKMHQFIWCKPYKAAGDEQVTLNANALSGRMAQQWTRGIVPAWTFALTVGCDLGKRFGHYVVIAWREDGRCHVVDYARFDILGDELGPAIAILAALRKWRDEVIMPGYAIEGEKTRWVPDQVWVDARYQGENKGDTAVYQFISEGELDRFRPTFGWGTGNYGAEHYRAPKATSKTVTAIGEGYHFEHDRVTGLSKVNVDADFWKGKTHDLLLAPLKNDAGHYLPGCLTLYHTPDRREHQAIAKHWSAEERHTEYIPGKGFVTSFKRLRRTNHYLDATSLNGPAGHLCGVRPIAAAAPPKKDPKSPAAEASTLETPDGQPYSILDR